MASIGPYSFASLTGRLSIQSPGGYATYRGIKRTKPQAQPSSHISTESFSTLAAAWTRARVYRAAIAAWAPVIDGGGLSCDAALICDVWCHISPKSDGGAELETAWTLVPHATYMRLTPALLIAEPLMRAPLDTEPVPDAIASTASSIGGVSMTAIYGDAQWPLTLGQLEAMQRAADDLGIDGIPQPSNATGALLMARPEASETDCALTMRNLRQMVGRSIFAEVGGVRFPCVIRDMDVDWSPTPGLPNSATHTLTARASLSMEDDSSSGDSLGVSVAVVQVASKWGSWVDVPGALCVEADEGLSGVSGTTSFTIDYGATIRGQRSREVPFIDYSGKWVRIQVREDESGTPSVRGTVRRSIWYGKCNSYQMTGGRGMSATAVFACAGLMAALQEIAPTRWYAIGQVLGIPAQGDVTTDPGDILSLTMSAAGNAVTNPGDVLPVAGGPQNAAKLPEVRPESGVATVAYGTHIWMAQMIVAALNAQTDGPRWLISDASNMLAGQYNGEPDGPTFGDLLSSVISARIGACYRIVVAETPGNPVSIVVNSTTPTLVNLPNGSTIPANTAQVAVDLASTGSPRLDIPAKPEKPRNALESWTLTRSRSGESDAIYVQGGRPVVAVTVGYKDGDADAHNRLIKGWSSADETAWDAASENLRNSAALQHVWRKFKLGTKYAGGSWFDDSNTNHTMRAGRQLDADGGETGTPVTLVAGGASVGPKPAQMRLTRFLPWSTNRDWAAAVQKFGLFSDEREEPERVRVWGKGGASNSYEDLSATWMVNIDTEDGAIIVGNDAADAVAIRAYLKSGKAILFTVGLESPIPWRVSWKRPDAERPCDWRRNITINDPKLTYWVAAAGTITSINDDFTARIVDVDNTYNITDSINGVQFGFARVVDGVPIPRLAEILRMARLWHQDQTPTIEFTRRGLDYSSTLAPGAMITTAALALDDEKQISRTINANITGRRWRFLASELATVYATDRLMLGGGGGIAHGADFRHAGAIVAGLNGAAPGAYR